MGVNIKDVAQQAGVSVTTVSRVLNNRGSISEKTKSKVFSTMHELNYHPNQVAVNLFKKHTQLVGLIVPDASHVFYAAEIKYLERALYAAGYKLLLCSSEDSNIREREHLSMLQRNKVDGIIIASHTLDLEDYGKVALPIVGLDRYLGKNIPTVSSDHESGGRLAAEEMLRCGCKNVVQFMGHEKVQTPSNKRHTSFEMVLKENGATCENYGIPLNCFNFIEYIEHAERLFSRNKQIDGVFATDNIICAVSKVAERLRIDIPRRLRLIGYDGTEISMVPTKSLTTIEQDIKSIAETTVNTLVSMIDKTVNFGQGAHIKIPVKLTRRETTL
jgi:LacI family sucrose operon transcriptional repressor